MPCNMVAVVAARMTVRAADLVGASEIVTNAVRAVVAQALNVPHAEVYTTNDADRLRISVGGYVFTLDSRSAELTGSATRRVSQTALDGALAQVGAALINLAGILLQQKAREALKMRFRMIEEMRTGAGAVVLTLEV